MHTTLVLSLICPCCNHPQLDTEVYAGNRNDIFEGRLICPCCRMWYRIEEGIVDLLPPSLRNRRVHEEFVVRHGLPVPAFEQQSNTDIRFVQIDFFKKCVDIYDRKVSDSTFYKALNKVTFFPWVRKNLRKTDNVINLGCGTGKQMLMLAQEGIPSLGIDISEEMLLCAYKKIKALGFGELVDFIIADALNPPLKNESFKACVLCSTLHHLPDPQGTLANIAKKLRVGGLVYISDPHKSPLRFIFDLMMRVWRLYDEEGNKNPLISRRQMAEWLSKAGLKGCIRISTYLPPHLMYLLSTQTNTVILKVSDYVFNQIPVIKNLGGVIITEAVKVG